MLRCLPDALPISGVPCCFRMKLPTGKLMLLLTASLALSGCASIAPPEPPSLELPKPPTDLHAVREGNTVTLSWTIPSRTTDRQNMRYLGKTRICRSLEATLVSCGTPVAEVAPPADFAALSKSGKKITANYKGDLRSGLRIGSNPSPFAAVTYAVEVLNLDGRSAGLSNQVNVPLVETLPPPSDFAAHLTGQGVVLTWTGASLPLPNSSFVRHSYRIFRRQEGSQQQILIGEVAATGAHEFSLSDQTMEWEKTYYYHADTLTMLAEPGKPEVSIEGGTTPEAKVFADDTFAPAVPTGLQAVFSGPGQQPFIDLVWSPVTDADLAGYNVYRREKASAPVKLNSTLILTPSYRDINVGAGETYFYSVSAVDQRGNESERSLEASETVPLGGNPQQ